MTFNPSQKYLIGFLIEAYKVYERNSLKYGLVVDKNDFIPLIVGTNKDVGVQQEMEDNLYQIEVQKSTGWSNRGAIIDLPVEKPLESDKTTSNAYKRNPLKGKNAIVDANYLCEIDVSHKDFNSKVTGMNYVEAHHLIPMEYQDYFNFSIDVEANLVSLCVSCHKKLHHANFSEVKPIIIKLYHERIIRLIKCNIEISLEKLLSYYN